MALKLEELLPENPSFMLKGKEYRFRIPNMEDKVRMTRIMPEKEMQQAFATRNWMDICKIVYPLIEDKTDFLARTVEEPDDEGAIVQKYITGPVWLLRAIKDHGEAAKMLSAFNKASIDSEPLMREAIEEEVKKNISEDLLRQATGEKSSNESQAPGDSPQSNSGPLPIGS